MERKHFLNKAWLTKRRSVCLQTIDSWSYDVFRLAEASGGAPLRHLGYELINRYGLFHKFKVRFK